MDDNSLLQMVFDTVNYGIEVLQPVYNDKGRTEDFLILLLNEYMLDRIGNIAYKGRLYGDIFPALKENGVLDQLIRVAETGSAAKFETRHDTVGTELCITAVKKADFLIVTTEDITAHKQTEAALAKALSTNKKQKRLYDSITDTTPDLVYVFDLTYHFTYANKALLAMWGKSAEEAIGKGLRENGYEEWHALMHEREIDQVAATKKLIRGTVSFPHAELGPRVYDYILGPVINERGEVEAVAGTTRDITDLKQAEESLQQSETRFRNMIEQAPVALLLSKGEDVVIESVNKPMLEFMNKTSEAEILGRTMLEVLPELAGQPALQTVIDVQNTGIPFRGDEQPVDLMINDKLERRYFNFSYNSIKEPGESSAVLHMAVDVTEQVLARRKLEESEARLKSMIDQTPAPTLVLMGDDLVIDQINQSMLGLIGHGEEVIGVPLIDVMPELRGQYVWREVEKVYREGVPFDQQEVKVTHKRTGVMQDYYYNIAYRPLKEEGKIIGMIQVAIDVTEQVVVRKRLEESERHYKVLSETLEQQVLDRTKELQRSNADLQQFAHVASHDLKEPVRKIKTFVNRLEQQLDGKLDSTGSRFVERIHVAANRMGTMIEGVLAYSTTNAGRQALESIDLNEVVRHIETDLELALQEKGATIELHHLPTLDGAQVLLYQLFYNLVNNSIKFAATNRPPRIKISSETIIEHHKSFARITVQDNGIGFEPEMAGLIFETFTRLNSKDEYEGTGLGLSLCKKIVERHSGSIEASGTRGQGATFTILLPMQQTKVSL